MEPSKSGFIMKLENDQQLLLPAQQEPSKSGFILNLESDQQLLLLAQHGTEQVRIYYET